MNFPLRTAFAVSHRFGLLWVHFHLFWETFWFIPWSHSWPIHCLVACYSVFMMLSALGFFLCGLFLVSVPCGQRKSLIWFQFFLNLLRLTLCLIMWSIFENVPCTLEKNVYFDSLGWKALYISVKSISSRVLLSDTLSFLIFCWEGLSIFDSGVLKSPTIIVLLSISFLKSSNI